MVFLWKTREKGKGAGGGGVGTGKGTDKSMRKLCRNYPLAIYPLKSARFLDGEAFLLAVGLVCLQLSF